MTPSRLSYRATPSLLLGNLGSPRGHHCVTWRGRGRPLGDQGSPFKRALVRSLYFGTFCCCSNKKYLNYSFYFFLFFFWNSSKTCQPWSMFTKKHLQLEWWIRTKVFNYWFFTSTNSSMVNSESCVLSWHWSD